MGKAFQEDSQVGGTIIREKVNIFQAGKLRQTAVSGG
jgi:hypothetical protein